MDTSGHVQDVLRYNGDTLGVDGAEIHVIVKSVIYRFKLDL